MIIRLPVAVLCLVVAACVARPPPDTAALPFAAFGTMDNDVAAANQAAWAFAAPERTANNPVDAARRRRPSTIWPAHSPAIRAG